MNRDINLLGEMYNRVLEQQIAPGSPLSKFIPKVDTNRPLAGGRTYFAVHPDYYKNRKPKLPGLGQLITTTPTGGLDLNETILFDFDKATLKPEGLRILQQIAQKISSLNNPKMQVQVTGYTDLYGGTSYNQQLSWSRAEAVSNILQKAGIKFISTKPGGMKNPKVPLKYDLVAGKAPQQGIDQQQPNRRVEIEFNPPLPKEIINSISTLR